MNAKDEEPNIRMEDLQREISEKEEIITNTTTELQNLKGSRGVGRAVSGAPVLSKGDMGSPEAGVSYSPGVTDSLYSLSTLKTVCAWRRAIPYQR
jgi:hypothetical protein